MPARRPRVPPKRSSAKEAKVTLGDTAAMKHALDTAVIDWFVNAGYEEDLSYSNFRLALSYLSIALALLAQFYPGTLTENWWLIAFCVFSYAVLSIVLALFTYLKQRDAILITKPGKKSAAPLRVSSLLPKFCEDYTLTIEPCGAVKPRADEMVHSVGRYFYEDGTLADSALSQDVSKLMHSFAKKD